MNAKDAGRDEVVRKPRVYRRADFTLTEVPLVGARLLEEKRVYRVETPSGEAIGTVGTYTAYMERRTPGKNYVNARWTAEKWWAREDETDRTYHGKFNTPGEAAMWIVRGVRHRIRPTPIEKHQS